MPCRSVGGDFFDYVDLPAGEFGFIVGDIAGKGSPAALLAAAVLGMFSAEAFYSDRVVVADHARQCRAVPARHRGALPDGVLRHPAHKTDR